MTSLPPPAAPAGPRVNPLASLCLCLLELLAPERCLVCGCARDRTPWASGLSGPAPALRSWHAPHLCRACHEAWRQPVRRGTIDGDPIWTPLVETAVLVRVVGAWKYRGQCGVVRPLGELLVPALLAARAASGPVTVVPVPLHRARRRERGFDQTRQLAVLAGRAAGLPVAVDLLVRARATRQQASEATQGPERRANVAGAFRTRRPPQDERRRVVVLDDLATTGATLAAAASALRATGWDVAGHVALGQATRLAAPGLDTSPPA